MGLDITFYENHEKFCPHCGHSVEIETVDSVGSSGRKWYPILEALGYYVPHHQRTEENDWYGKDMVLNPNKVKEVYSYVKNHIFGIYNGQSILGLLAKATLNENIIVINANW